MEITGERPSTDVIMDIELTDKEYDLLLSFAKSHMPEEEINKCMIEWALLDAIKQKVGLNEDTAS